MQKVCVICGKSFTAKNRNNITCSTVCSKVNKNLVNKRRRDAKRDKKNYTYALSAIEAKARMVGMTYG